MALAKLAQEDPTFKVHTDPDSGQTIISGMGELHLEIIVDRMMREYKVEANVGKPQVAYRETIRKNAEAEGKYIRQTGGSGNYGHVKIRVEPNEPGKGFEFSNDIKGGVIPKEYIKPIEQGIREAMQGGVLAGYEMVDVKVIAVRRQLSRCRLERNGLQDCRFDGLQGSGPQGEAGAARAGDGGRSDGAGRVHGHHHRRPELPPRPHRRHGAWSADRRSIKANVPLNECSAMRPTCVLRRRAARTTRCSSSSMKRRRGRSRKRSSAEGAGQGSQGNAVRADSTRQTDEVQERRREQWRRKNLTGPSRM